MKMQTALRIEKSCFKNFITETVKRKRNGRGLQRSSPAGDDLIPFCFMHRIFAVVLALFLSSAMAAKPFYVRFELAGHGVAAGAAFTLRVEPAWAPIGAARFRELVETKFYDDQRFFRVLDGMYDIWIAQFGISGDPATHAIWRSKSIKDDPVAHSNTRGTISFAMSGPNTRTSQLFLNFGDSSKVLDGDFAPFGEVVEGMPHVDTIYKVGEGAPSGSGPTQGEIVARGNAYLDSKFPKLTKVVTARVVAAPGGGDEL